MHVLIVDDSASIRAYLAQLAINFGLKPIMAVDGSDALNKYREFRPAVILLDVDMPGISGLDVARAIRADERLADSTDWTPIIFLTGLATDEQLAKGIEAGGDDYLVKPVSEIVLSAKIEAMRRIQALRKRLIAVTEDLAAANRKLHLLAIVDGMTGIANRRHLDEQLELEWRRAVRQDNEISFMMIDVDHFKQYNDAYGHQQGDDCLKRVAQLLADCARRPGDLAARYGGEEFAIMLPCTPAYGAGHVAIMVQKGIVALQIDHKASSVCDVVTASIGVATVRPKEFVGTLAGFTELADHALYEAKRAGRNRVVSSGNLQNSN